MGRFRRRAGRKKKEKSKGQAARRGEKQSAIARPVFTLWQRCEDMKRGSGVLWQAPLLFIPVSDKENKAPACFLHSLFVCMRHKAAGRPARDSHRADLSVIFVDRKQVWVSGHFLWLPVPHHLSALEAAASVCRLLMPRAHGREQAGLVGPKAGGEGAGPADYPGCLHTCVHMRT